MTPPPVDFVGLDRSLQASRYSGIVMSVSFISGLKNISLRASTSNLYRDNKSQIPSILLTCRFMFKCAILKPFKRWVLSASKSVTSKLFAVKPALTDSSELSLFRS